MAFFYLKRNDSFYLKDQRTILKLLFLIRLIFLFSNALKQSDKFLNNHKMLYVSIKKIFYCVKVLWINDFTSEEAFHFEQVI